jgi:hypothetical protein
MPLVDSRGLKEEQMTLKRMTLKRLICGLGTVGALSVGVGCGSSGEGETNGPDNAVSTTSEALYAQCALSSYQGNCLGGRWSCGGGSWYVCELTHTSLNSTTTLRNATGTGHWARILWNNNTFSDCKWLGAGETNYFYPNSSQWASGANDIQDC